MNRYFKSIVILAFSLAVAIAFASVFVYYPITLDTSPVAPPVKFDPGSNAGQPDLSGSITVNIGANGTSVSITLHPTYQKTYYKNITIINNTAATAFHIWIRVNTQVSLNPGDTAVMNIYDSLGNFVGTVDLTVTGDTYVGQVSGNDWFRIDVEYNIAEGNLLPSLSTADIEIIYSPVYETPP